MATSGDFGLAIDRCRLTGTATRYIEPGSSWENPFVESFNGRVRDELLNVEEFRHPHRGDRHRRGLADRVQDLSTHSSLGGLTPAECRARWVPEIGIPRHP